MANRPSQTVTRLTLLIGMALIVVALAMTFGLREEHQSADDRGLAARPGPSPEVGADRADPSPEDRQAVDTLTFEAPVADSESMVPSQPRERGAQTTASLGTSFEPEFFALTTREIFREYWQNALAWTADDFYRVAERRDALTGPEAYEAYVYVRTCLDAPRSQRHLDRRLERLEGVHEMSPRIEAMIQRGVDALFRCEGLEEADLNMLALDWLTLSAELGYPQAQVAYYKSPRWLINRTEDAVFRDPDLAFVWRDRAASFLLQAVRSGHPDALLEYSDAVSDGILFDDDPVQAYAWAWAAQQAAHGEHGESAGKLRELDNIMTATERSDARELGRSICEQYCRVDS